jgi:SulP family sulfate permease
MREMPIRAHARDVFAGLIAGVVTIAYGLSFAALIFGPPLAAWLAYGIAATFLTSAIIAAFVAARSSLPFAIAGPDPTTVAVTATLVSALVARLTYTVRVMAERLSFASRVIGVLRR